ncbi:hypothetical protein ASF90_18345 [Xanthomonas sp. Leaf148]|nr:hypothetical protein ASF90_18345 [Xanthomonas sp. Leaf148]
MSGERLVHVDDMRYRMVNACSIGLLHALVFRQQPGKHAGIGHCGLCMQLRRASAQVRDCDQPMAPP